MAFRYRLFAIVATITLLADQLTKYWARQALEKYGYAGYTVIENFWVMRLSFNRGSAFGLFGGMTSARIWLTIIGLGACAAIVYIMAKTTKDHQKWVTTALALVFGGAIGNVLDRIMFGQVTDFVVWKYHTHEWPAFNIADAVLLAGVLVMFLDIGREQKREKQKQKDEQGDSA